MILDIGLCIFNMIILVYIDIVMSYFFYLQYKCIQVGIIGLIFQIGALLVFNFSVIPSILEELREYLRMRKLDRGE